MTARYEASLQPRERFSRPIFCECAHSSWADASDGKLDSSIHARARAPVELIEDAARHVRQKAHFGRACTRRKKNDNCGEEGSKMIRPDSLGANSGMSQESCRRSGHFERRGEGGLNPWAARARYRTGSHAQIFFGAPEV
jgi:hypothetical protein